MHTRIAAGAGQSKRTGMFTLRPRPLRMPIGWIEHHGAIASGVERQLRLAMCNVNDWLFLRMGDAQLVETFGFKNDRSATIKSLSNISAMT